MEQPIEHIRSLINDASLDGALISSSTMIAYLTEFFGFSPLQRDAFLFVTSQKAFLLTSPLYSEETKKIRGIQTLTRSSNISIKQLIETICQKEKIITLGFEANNMTVAEFSEFKKIDVTLKPFDLHSLRKTKTEKEIASIRQATTLSLQALEKVNQLFSTGVTEIELVQKLELEMKILGVDPSFPTIVAFGENAAVPHHVSDKTKLKKADVILIDFGVKYHGYCSDTTRTFFVGKVSEKWKKIYDTVKRSQELAAEYINRQLASQQPIPVCDVDKVARDYIITNGYPTMPHSLGHGIGLEVHEYPTLSPNAKDLLTEGMVFSIEPGIYLPGEMGVRIEDVFAIQDNKLISLTKSSIT